MFLFFIFTVIFLYYYRKYHKQIGFSPLLIYFIATFFLSLFSLECIFRGIEFFTSDEITYINSASDKLLIDHNRFLWYFINDLILNHDISLNGIALKLINIPVAGGFLLVLWRIFKNKKIFMMPIILPYFSYIATKNFRDIPILFLSGLSVFIFYNFKSWYAPLGFLSFGLLFLLRPFAAGFIFIILLLQMCFLSVKPILKLRLSKSYSIKLIWLFIICLSILPFAAQTLERKVAKHYAYLKYTINEGKDIKAEKRVQSDPRYYSGNAVRDFFVASIRYAVTPIPTSLIKRSIKGGSNWGLVDDLIRIANQIGYYFLVGYLGINIRYIPTVFLLLTPAGKALILLLLAYWPIYSFHLYGVTHQRLKLPLQIAIFLVALSVSEYKRNRYKV